MATATDPSNRCGPFSIGQSGLGIFPVSGTLAPSTGLHFSRNGSHAAHAYQLLPLSIKSNKLAMMLFYFEYGNSLNRIQRPLSFDCLKEAASRGRSPMRSFEE